MRRFFKEIATPVKVHALLKWACNWNIMGNEIQLHVVYLQDTKYFVILISGIYLGERTHVFPLCYLNSISFLFFKLPETDTDIGAARYARYLYLMLLGTPSNKHWNYFAQKKSGTNKTSFLISQVKPQYKPEHFFSCSGGPMTTCLHKGIFNLQTDQQAFN